MPRSVEHLVETHLIAQQRRDAGRPIWDHRVDLTDVFRNEVLSFEGRRDCIVKRLLASPWLAGRDEFDPLVELVRDHLAYAEDAEDFDGWWDEIYDHADIDRVWIKTR